MNFNTIYFWPQPDNCIKNILRILKPGGKLILAFVDKAQLESRPLSTNVFHFYHQDEIIKLLSRNGFSGSIDMISKEYLKADVLIKATEQPADR